MFCFAYSKGGGWPNPIDTGGRPQKVPAAWLAGSPGFKPYHPQLEGFDVDGGDVEGHC